MRAVTDARTGCLHVPCILHNGACGTNSWHCRGEAVLTEGPCVYPWLDSGTLLYVDKKGARCQLAILPCAACLPCAEAARHAAHWWLKLLLQTLYLLPIQGACIQCFLTLRLLLSNTTGSTACCPVIEGIILVFTAQHIHVCL